MTHMLFLRPGTQGPVIIQGQVAGKPEPVSFGRPNRRESKVPKKIHRRGEGGEGRVRMQVRDLCSLHFTFVQVFSGYVASLSVVLI
jgi:hypothetical protein